MLRACHLVRAVLDLPELQCCCHPQVACSPWCLPLLVKSDLALLGQHDLPDSPFDSLPIFLVLARHVLSCSLHVVFYGQLSSDNTPWCRLHHLRVAAFLLMSASLQSWRRYLHPDDLPNASGAIDTSCHSLGFPHSSSDSTDRNSIRYHHTHKTRLVSQELCAPLHRCLRLWKKPMSTFKFQAMLALRCMPWIVIVCFFWIHSGGNFVTHARVKFSTVHHPGFIWSSITAVKTGSVKCTESAKRSKSTLPIWVQNSSNETSKKLSNPNP